MNRERVCWLQEPLCAGPAGTSGARGRARQHQPRVEAPGRHIVQRERAAVRLCDIARDAQSESRATAVAVARGLEAVEGLEHALQLLHRDARPRIAHADNELRAILDEHVGLAAEL